MNTLKKREWYEKIYLDSLTDERNWLTLDEIERNIIISTWLNKQNIKWLAKNIILTLVDKLTIFKWNLTNWSSLDYNLFAKENSELIFTLWSLFNSQIHDIISWVSTYEKWWSFNFKHNLNNLINGLNIDGTISRSDKKFFLWLLWDQNHDFFSSTIIENINKNDPNFSFDSFFIGSSKLVVLKASLISKYLANYNNISNVVQKTSWNVQAFLTI
jgi:hypothetical protein